MFRYDKFWAIKWCISLEHKLGRSLLRLACRHHKYEVYLRGAFESKFPDTSVPIVLVFSRFKATWQNIDKTKYEPGIRDEKIRSVIDDQTHDELVKFCKDALKKNIARDDYKELLELTLIFLEEDSGAIRFREPGADHHARWMSKAIYRLKIFMFLNQFQVSRRDKPRLRGNF